jgi:hypothetical protein
LGGASAGGAGAIDELRPAPAEVGELVRFGQSAQFCANGFVPNFSAGNEGELRRHVDVKLLL